MQVLERICDVLDTDFEKLLSTIPTMETSTMSINPLFYQKLGVVQK